MSGRIRSVKPEILEDEKTAGLDDHTWRLFVSLFCLADDYGNLRGSADWLHGQVFWKTPETIEKTRESLATLSRLSLVTPYAASGQAYLAITNWARHQRVDKPGKPRVPGPKDPGSVGQNKDSRESPEIVASVQESPTLARAPAGGQDLDPDLRTMGVDPPPSPKGGATAKPRGQSSATAKVALPDGWAPNDQHRGQAAELMVDIGQESVSFRDHHSAKGSKFADWDAAFRTWLRNARKFADERGVPLMTRAATSRGPTGLEDTEQW